MGAWSVSVTGNDTAADLKDEYACAFYRYDADTALQKIESYVCGMFDESDPEEWCAYVYSLADFMWRKGILTDEIRQRALQMIDSGFGLELWEESGLLAKRQKALAEFRAKLLSPMGKPKKIKPSIRTEDIFTSGDVIAVRLMTAGKSYAKHANRDFPMTDDEFHAFDGKYILMQKAWCHISWHSALVPEIGNHWAVFRLFNGVYDTPPAQIDIDRLQPVTFETGLPYFQCESSMFYFKKRKFQVLGNHPQPAFPPPPEQHAPDNRAMHIFFSVSNQWWDPDAQFLAAMRKS